jgi:hypothetical protein
MSLTFLQYPVWFALDSEVEDIWTSIMPGDIMHPSWSAHLTWIDLGIEDRFLFPSWSSNERSIRIDYGGPLCQDNDSKAIKVSPPF